jgi:predicted permease
VDFLLADLRYAARRLIRSPGFTAAAVISLALGIGANTAIFSVVDAILLRDSPARSPEQLVELYTSDRGGYQYGTFSEPDFRDVREQASAFTDVATRHAAMLAAANPDGTSDVLWGEVVSGNLFELLGLEAALGRALTSGDDAPPAELAAVIGHGLWTRRFGADPDVVGRAIRLNGSPVTVVGVMPEGFTGQFPAFQMDVWIPLGGAVRLNLVDAADTSARDTRRHFPVARLAPGVTVERAQEELDQIALQLGREHPSTNEGRAMTLLPSEGVSFNPVVDQALVPIAALLMAVVGLVLAIACANLASLLLVRAAGRQREIATRLAVGAGRGRVVRQLLTESLLLALLGGAGGLGLAFVAVKALIGFSPPIPIPVRLDITLDGSVLMFTVLVSLATGVLFGLAPALRASRPDVLAAMKDGGVGALGKRKWFALSNVLVVGQVTVSLLLMVTAGLFVRSLAETRGVEAGFDTESLVVASINLEQYGYTGEEGSLFIDRLTERLMARPDVRSATVTARVPVGIAIQTNEFVAEGQPWPDTGSPSYDYTRTDGRYFETFGVPLIRGRTFGPQDAGGPDVAIVSETAARHFWPGEDPVGKRLRLGGENGPLHEVVGLAADTKVRTLGEAPRPYIYLPPSPRGTDFAMVVVATRGEPAAFLPALREEIRAIDPAVTPFDSGTIQDQLSIMLYPAKMGAVLLAGFGALALLLAVTGLYGVVSYTASRRTREVGIRMAIGAAGRDITTMMLRDGAIMVLVGTVLGLGLALVATRVLGRFLYGVGVNDPLTFLAIPVVLAAVALVAAWLPARKAARLDPVRALHSE